MTAADFPVALPPRHALLEYRIEQVLGHGGFGITYLATDTTLRKKVAIKEYLPAQFAVRAEGATVMPRTRRLAEDYRWGLERFLDEARASGFIAGSIARAGLVGVDVAPAGPRSPK